MDWMFPFAMWGWPPSGSEGGYSSWGLPAGSEALVALFQQRWQGQVTGQVRSSEVVGGLAHSISLQWWHCNAQLAQSSTTMLVAGGLHYLQ